MFRNCVKDLQRVALYQASNGPKLTLWWIGGGLVGWYFATFFVFDFGEVAPQVAQNLVGLRPCPAAFFDLPKVDHCTSNPPLLNRTFPYGRCCARGRNP